MLNVNMFAVTILFGGGGEWRSYEACGEHDHGQVSSLTKISHRNLVAHTPCIQSFN